MATKMTFQFLDVGMGDSTLVQIRDTNDKYDTLILVDFGELRTQFKDPTDDAMCYLVTTINDNSLKRGLNRPFVDYLFITHPDGDHYNKIKALTEADFPDFPNKYLHFGDLYFSGKKGEYPGLMKHLEDNNLVDAGIDEMSQQYHSTIGVNGPEPTWKVKAVNIYVLSSNYPTTASGDTNAKSIVLLFELGKYKVILPGDAEKKTEEYIMETFEDHLDFLEAYALKLGHHGSKAASCEDWIDVVKPKAIFASGDFVWSHPYCETICRFIDAGTLGPGPAAGVRYCCGERYIYYNNSTTKAICMNLWYNVSLLTEQMFDEYLKKLVIAGKNNTFGVQWALEIDTSSRTITRSDSSVPVPPNQGQPPGWNCDGSSNLDLIELPTSRGLVPIGRLI